MAGRNILRKTKIKGGKKDIVEFTFEILKKYS